MRLTWVSFRTALTNLNEDRNKRKCAQCQSTGVSIRTLRVSPLPVLPTPSLCFSLNDHSFIYQPAVPIARQPQKRRVSGCRGRNQPAGH